MTWGRGRQTPSGGPRMAAPPLVFPFSLGHGAHLHPGSPSVSRLRQHKLCSIRAAVARYCPEDSADRPAPTPAATRPGACLSVLSRSGSTRRQPLPEVRLHTSLQWNGTAC
ncbi:hypothetical protein GQ607_012440 [Colletotrichum asianum]|uniref:Uncharacterized protein n=1 Tax=Colletotrichum asianum TaxID=702518 RepID=A0A8H3W4G2_9PEZI|nr:hypothetical protein GQ607_012440 [Colletotrichum asianum]